MRDKIIIIGIGQLGGVFGRGFLAAGHPVFPVTREMAMPDVAEILADPKLVLVAVAEDNLNPVLRQIPPVWQDRLGLLQNELLPRDWQEQGIENPTVISAWFEKKKGTDSKVLLSSPVYGPNADVIKAAMEAVDIPAHILDNEFELEYELVRKNVYIITINVAGLLTGGTVGGLWENHRDLARQVASEVIDIQAWLTGSEFDRERLIDGMVEAFEPDPNHKCMGRTAPVRLRRVLHYADQAGLAVPKLREIGSKKL